MSKADEGHKLTDKELVRLERRITQVFRDAAAEMQETVTAYFAQLEKRDAEMRAMLVAGEIDEAHYKQWRLNQIGRGKSFEALRDEMTSRMADAGAVAYSYINDATPGIYSLNRNFAAYTVELLSGKTGFSLWDERTVRRLLAENSDLMPYYPKKLALKRGFDIAWGKKCIKSTVTSSILQGHGIKQMADTLQRKIPTMNRDSAIRAARTAVTGAQNGGRQDTYHAAAAMGIKLKKEWLATLDGRTRPAHGAADGQQVDEDQPFIVDGYKMMYPGDTSAPAYLVYNCRCTTVAAVDGVDMSDALRRDKDGLVTNMTFAQWEASKRGYSGVQVSPYHRGGSSAKDVTEKYRTEPKRTGKIRYEEGYRHKGHQEEIRVAEQIHGLFGGKIILRKESEKQYEKTPDYTWKGKGWELKTISSAKAGDSALRSAIKQIRENPGGVILNCRADVDVDSLISTLDNRVLRHNTFDFDVIALQNGRMLFARRYRK